MYGSSAQQQQQQGLGGYSDYDSTSGIISGSSMGTVPGYNNNINNHINNNHINNLSTKQQQQHQQQMHMLSTNQEEILSGDFLGYGDFMRYNQSSSQSSLVTEARDRVAAAADFSQGGDINNNSITLDPALSASLLSITNLENSAGSSFSYGM
jgi:hypothetical protein